MFAFRKNVAVLVACLLFPISPKNFFLLDYEDIYCALLLVDYWKSLRRCVSVVRLRVVVKVALHCGCWGS